MDQPFGVGPGVRADALDEDFDGEYDDEEEEEEIIDHEAKIAEVYNKYKGRDPTMDQIDDDDDEDLGSFQCEQPAYPDKTPAKTRFQQLPFESGDKAEEQKVPDTPGQNLDDY